ncbi:MAG: hypothetical protein JWP19_1343 [Rhodoglobus sp.]|nr:hypothetical protein [Rhodoglobus sp.]
MSGARMRCGAAAVGIVFAASLVLTGCSILPSAPAATGGTAGPSGSQASDPTSGPTQIDAVQGFEGMPATFPVSDVPIIAGDIPFGIDLGTGWTVIVKVSDLTAAFTDAGDKLKAAGYTAQVEQAGDSGSFGDYLSDKYQVQVTAQNTQDYGPSVTYVVVLQG